MKLTFLYHPVEDIPTAAAFHRDELGFEEAWREGDDTVAFWLPGRTAQIMVSTTNQPAGPMFLVESVDGWLGDHPGVGVAVDTYDIPGGEVVGLVGPNGYVFYVFDQPNA
jgi:hypothetical protein